MFKNSFFFRYLSPYYGRLILNATLRFLAALFNMVLLLGIAPFLSLIFGQADLVDKPEHFSLSSEGLFEYLKYIVSLSVETYGKAATLIYVVVFIAVMYFLKNLFSYLGMYLFTPIRNLAIQNIRKDLYKKLLILPISYYTGNKKGDIITRLTSDIQEIDQQILLKLQQVMIDVLLFLTMFVALFFLSAKLSLVVLVVIPLAGFLTSSASKVLRRSAPELQRRNAELISQTEESMAGIKIIKGFNAIDYTNEKFQLENEIYTRTKNKVYYRQDLGSPLSEFLGTFAVIIVLIFGGMLILQDGGGGIAPEAFITYIIFLTQIIAPMKNILGAYYSFRRGKASVRRVKDVLYADERIIEKEKPIRKSDFQKSIVFDQVGFCYETEPVLKDLSFSIEKGKYVAIVGPSGAGKSTILDLLPRFYDVTSGEIRLDDIPIKDLKISDLRELSAIVSQDVVLFNDTVFNNIAYGREEVTKEQLIQAAKAANAHEFIVELENGYDTNIGDGGMNLSGGQRQRLSIARAILKDAPILILDEATSALDTHAEKLVQEAINNLSKNRTTIAVAHRLSTIYHADLILVIDQGRIVERGTHLELMKNEGLYKKWVENN